ncbi:MAG: hypothetical protein FJX67_15300 [Alphaproteobacteria bacterium]|nr:hypothetical protein [Alphaproteobacteria bacterium]
MDLTIALDRYDRHVPFFTDPVTLPGGVTLKPLEVGESKPNRHGQDRHGRMLHHLEFDIAEMSLASYIMALSRDPALPLVGIPVFPRRLFSMSQMYVNARTGIETPRDLVGKRVGIHAFQVTLSVLAKGDLKLEYGVPWEEIRWVTMNPENVPISFRKGVSVERMPAGADIGEMLMAGEIDALFSPQPRQSMLTGTDRVRRLFPDSRAEEKRYFDKYAFWPIMHLLVAKRAVIDKAPTLPAALIGAWEQAKARAYAFYDDSNYALLAWTRLAFEEERRLLGPDPWHSGLARNRKNLDQFIGYCHDQGLIETPLPVEAMFHPMTHGT